MLAQMPTPQSGRAFTGSASLDDGPQDQETLKVDHRWSGSWTTTAMYGHQYTREPGSAFWGSHGTIPADPGGTTLFRTVHFFSTNQVIVPNNTTAIAVRYGYNRFDNDGSNYPGSFAASSLGYPSNFTSVLADGAFPSISMNGYSGIGHGGRSITNHVGQPRSASVSRFMAKRSVPFGAADRRIEAQTIPPNNGTSGFSQAFTQGPNPNTASSVAGDSFASFLLGYPATGDVNVATPGTYYTDYYEALAQDDFRVSSTLTGNARARDAEAPGQNGRPPDRY